MNGQPHVAQRAVAHAAAPPSSASTLWLLLLLKHLQNAQKMPRGSDWHHAEN